MAAIDFPATPSVGQLFAAGNGVTYKWSGVMWIPIGGASMMSIGDTPPTTPGNGQLWWNSVLGTLMLYYTDPNTSQWVPAIAAGSNKLLQEISVETGAVATGTTTFSNADSIPANTNGDQYMSLAITPQSATSRLIIEVVGNFGNSVQPGTFSMGLFQDSGACLAAVGITFATAALMGPMTLRHVMTSGMTSTTTFKIRAGSNVASTTTFNGFSSGRIYGGVMASSIVIREVTT